MNNILLNSNKAFVSAVHASKLNGDYITIEYDVEVDDYSLCWGHAQKTTESLEILQFTMGLRPAFYALKSRGVPISAKAELLLINGAFD